MTGGGEGDGGRRWRLVRASTDAVPSSVRRFFMAAGRRGGWSRRRRRPGARPGGGRRRVWALAGAVLALVLFVGWLAWGTSLWGVREVRVTGTEILPAAEVREAAAVAEQTPLLRVRPDEVAARVGALAPVATVRVRRAWPDTVVIEVVERTAVAAVPSADVRGDGDGESGPGDGDGESVPGDGRSVPGAGADRRGFLLVDAGGVVFHSVAQAPEDLPVVIVAEPGPADPATQAAMTVLAALTPQLRDALETLTVRGPASIRLTLSSGWTVVWGDQTESPEKARVTTALLARQGAPGADGVIDVSAPEVVSMR